MSRVARLLPNDRVSAWGLIRRGRMAVLVILEPGEVDTVRLDATTWLNTGETITTATASGTLSPTIAIAAGSMAVDLTITGASGTRECDVTLTTSAARKRIVGVQAQATDGLVSDRYRQEA